MGKCTIKIDREYGRRQFMFSGEILKENYSRVNINMITFCLGYRFLFLQFCHSAVKYTRTETLIEELTISSIFWKFAANWTFLGKTCFEEVICLNSCSYYFLPGAHLSSHALFPTPMNIYACVCLCPHVNVSCMHICMCIYMYLYK